MALESKKVIFWWVVADNRNWLLSAKQIKLQCNLDLVTLILVTTCDLVTILQRPFFILLHKSIGFSDIMWFSDSFCRDQKWD